MKRFILLAAALLVAPFMAAVAQADNTQPPASGLTPGSPGTATPTPYPQVTPPSIPRAGGTQGNSPLLPKIEVPRPPKDQSLPGLEQNPDADKEAPGKP
jgi:hypothetical protein